jgi:RimJ/RimL family protein N-acetyltransferase
MADILLRDTAEADLPLFFEHQKDEEARHMAAFTSTDPTDEAAFMSRWGRILEDDTILKKTVVVGGDIAGHVVSFERDGVREVSYWLGSEFWGRGIGAAALARFLEMYELQRPVRARVAADNAASVRLLERRGFRVVNRQQAFANDRQAEVEELTMVLD